MGEAKRRKQLDRNYYPNLVGRYKGTEKIRFVDGTELLVKEKLVKVPVNLNKAVDLVIKSKDDYEKFSLAYNRQEATQMAKEAYEQGEISFEQYLIASGNIELLTTYDFSKTKVLDYVVGDLKLDEFGLWWNLYILGEVPLTKELKDKKVEVTFIGVAQICNSIWELEKDGEEGCLDLLCDIFKNDYFWNELQVKLIQSSDVPSSFEVTDSLNIFSRSEILYSTGKDVEADKEVAPVVHSSPEEVKQEWREFYSENYND